MRFLRLQRCDQDIRADDGEVGAYGMLIRVVETW